MGVAASLVPLETFVPEQYLETFRQHNVTAATLANMSAEEMTAFFITLNMSDDAEMQQLVNAIVSMRGGEQTSPAATTVSSNNTSASNSANAITSGEDHPSTNSIVIMHGENKPAEQFVGIEVASMSPRVCLSQIFQIQGIKLDPDEVDAAADAIAKAVGPSTASEEDGTYDVFINYRVASEKVVAELLYSKLCLRKLRPFLDKFCLVNGMDWKEGFLRGLGKSRYFVALLSRKGLANFRDITKDHSHDNVLIEYETALTIMKKTGNNRYLIPVLVGAYKKDGTSLKKFADFSPSLYSDSVHAQEGEEGVDYEDDDEEEEEDGEGEGGDASEGEEGEESEDE